MFRLIKSAHSKLRYARMKTKKKVKKSNKSKNYMMRDMFTNT